MPEPADSADRASVLIAVTASTVAFTVAFNYAAFDTVFFERVFAVWVAATIVLIASVLTSVGPQTWPRRLPLLVPTLWLIFQTLWTTGAISVAENVVDWMALLVAVATLPFLAYVLVGAINPAFLHLPDRNKWAVIGAVVLFTIIGTGVGARNDFFLTCEDFKVSGNDLPTNCRTLP